MAPSARTTIRVLTVLLNEYPQYHDAPQDLHETKYHTCETKLFGHASSLLNCTADGSVASTGWTDVEETSLTVVLASTSIPSNVPSGSSNTLPLAQDTSTKPEFSILRVFPSEQEVDINDFASPKSNEPYTVKCHAQDLLRVLMDYKQKACDPQKRYNKFNVAEWVTARCHASVARRIRLARKLWDSDPRKAMKDWTPQTYEQFTENGKEVKINDVDRDFANRRLKEYWTMQDEKQRPAPLVLPTSITASTIPAFINALGELLAMAEVLSGAADYRRFFTRTLRIICWILKSQLVKRAFSFSSLSYAFRRKSITMKLLRTTGPRDVGGDDSGLDDDSNEADEDDARSLLNPVPGENEGQVVLRYLLMIVAPFTACSVVLPRIRRLPGTPEISIVELTDHRKEASRVAEEQYMNVLLERVSTHITASKRRPGEIERASKWLRELASRKFEVTRPLYVHAEAGIIGLLKIPRTSDNHEIVQHLQVHFDESAVLGIGVSQKSCATCTLLWKLASGKHNPSRDKEVCISGSHGQVVPWDPPSFGMDDSVLEGIADGLCKKMADVAFAQAEEVEVSSRTSSPTTSEEDEDEDWQNDDYELSDDELDFEGRTITL
ncbi:uncharacterized protein BXZ73DRAFT_75933 [Epithele typhae]|uniref:uncharacterized protein n=1 Tax=Epithele typhae TaxID=378194 RepID=UPI0020072C12|nr:uncharacterized protein BXZ73DRAFT_75933 [Epithele typhae]KAH9939761.1 hypothetical protein BXZ73DRAFT_75933 [Epithele typhae]